MNVLTYGAEDLNSTYPKFNEYSGAVAFETANPLYGRASLKFSQGSVQYVGKAFPYTPVSNSWQGFHFKASVISACGLVQWLTGTSSRGDLRFNASTRKLEARINGTLVVTSAKIFNADTLYHLQLFVTTNASYQHLQVKVDDLPLLVLNYFANTGASPANYDRFRWGPFLGGGSGTLLMDDIVVNDSLPGTGGDYNWPGRLAVTDAGPTGNGTDITNQWSHINAATADAAVDELDHDSEATTMYTRTHRRRHALTFGLPEMPVGGILESVGFDVIVRCVRADLDSGSLDAKCKLRFRSDETPVDEVQTVTITEGEAGDTFTFGYEGVNSQSLAYDASLATVQAEADTIFGEFGCVVSGTPGSSYIFTFGTHWSQTRMLLMEVAGVFAGSGTPGVSVARTTDGAGIYETGDPFVYVPLELEDDALTDAYPEALPETYTSRTARRRVALDGGAWNRTKADVVELVLRADLPFSLEVDTPGGGGGGVPEEFGALNDAALNEVPL